MNNLDTLLIAIAVFVCCFVLIKMLKIAKTQAEEITNSDIKNVIDYALRVVNSVVGAINQEMVDELKNKGKFDKNAAINAKNNAKQRIDNILGEEAKNILEISLGSVDKFLNDAIENAVNEKKK